MVKELEKKSKPDVLAGKTTSDEDEQNCLKEMNKHLKSLKIDWKWEKYE